MLVLQLEEGADYFGKCIIVPPTKFVFCREYEWCLRTKQNLDISWSNYFLSKKSKQWQKTWYKIPRVFTDLTKKTDFPWSVGTLVKF